MLAHTTSRHIIIASQLAIGILLLSASYFSEGSYNNIQMNASAESTKVGTEMATHSNANH